MKIGSVYHGTFARHCKALACVRKKTGLEDKDLLLKADHVRRSLQGQRNAVSQHVVWFRRLYNAYSTSQKVAYPGDLNDMGARALRRSRILAHPNFIILMLFAKFGPHRDVLHDAFLSVPKPKHNDSDLKWTYLVIVNALVALSRIEIHVMAPWLAGPGKQSAFHSGLAVYAHKSLKILIPCDEEPQEPQSKKRKVVLGKQQRAFLIQPYSSDIEKDMTQLRAFGLALLKGKPPNSLAEWSLAMTAMTSSVSSAPGIPTSTCYRYKWVTRGFWDYRRRLAGSMPGIMWSKNATVPNVGCFLC